MEQELTAEQKLNIRESFIDSGYHRPPGEIVVAHLLAAMIASGKFKPADYPRLVEEAFILNATLVLRFDEEVKREVRETIDPKPPASEKGSMNSDSNSEAYDPIPF